MAEATSLPKSTPPALMDRVVGIAAAVLPTVLMFLIVGPVVGYFAALLPVSMSAISGPLGILEGLASAVVLMPVGVPLAYVLGFLPAVLTGLAVAMVDLLADLGSYRTPMAIITGALVTIGLLHRAAGLDLSITTLSDIPGSAAGGAIGAIAAAVCALLAPRRVPVRRSLDDPAE